MIIIPGATPPRRPRTARKKARMCATEHQECVALNHWRLAHLRQLPELRNLILIPNGEERKSEINKKGRRYSMGAQRLRDEGLEPGSSDYFLAVPRGGFHGFWIEMKAKDGEKQPTQVEFGDRMISLGYQFAFLYGWEAASKAIVEYLNLPKPLES